MIQQQLAEDGAVQDTAILLAGDPVQLLRSLQQAQGGQQHRLALRQVRHGRAQIAAKASLLLTDHLEALADLFLRPVRVADQVEKSVFLLVERGNAALDLGAHAVVERISVVDGRASALADLLAKRCRDRHERVVRHDAGLNLSDRHVGQIATAVLSADADVVEVLLAALAAAGIDDEAFAAAAAPDRSLEVVVVRALTRPCASLSE